MNAAEMSWSIDCSATMPAAATRKPVRASGVVERHAIGNGRDADPLPNGAKIVRRWEAGQTDRLNEAHWADAHGQPIDHDLAVDLPTLRARAQHEFHNNPMIEGVVNTHAVDLVGPDGPDLEVTSDSDRYNDRLEAMWREWCEQADYNGELGLSDILQLWVRQIWTGGALFGQQVSDDTGSSFPATLRILPLHCNRLETPWGMVGDANVAFGIRRNAHGRPLTYYVSQPKNMGPYQTLTGDWDPVPADMIHHGFIPAEPGQTVGYPLLASALPAIADLRDYDRSVLDAARLAADRSEWFVNINPSGVPYEETDDEGNPVSFEVGYKRMSTRSAPPGWDVRSHDATHPTANYVEHRRERLAELGRAAAMPLMLIRLDSASHNYSSARFDHQYYVRHLQTWQSWIARRQLNRMVSTVARELWLAGEIRRPPAGGVKYRFNFKPPPLVDPTKERAAEKMGLANRTLTFADACRANNRQEDDVIESWVRTLHKLRQSNMNEDDVAMFLQSFMGRLGGPTGTPNAARGANTPTKPPEPARA